MFVIGVSLFVFAFASSIRLLMAHCTPKLYAKVVEEEKRKKERRNAALVKGLGIASKFIRK